MFQLLKIQHKSATLLDAKELLPHPTTVSRNLAQAANSSRAQLAQDLTAALSNGRVAFSSDMWMDEHKKRSYTTITAHWITKDFKLVNRVVCTEEFDATLKKTGVNVKDSIMSALSSFGIEVTCLKTAFSPLIGDPT